ncbi:MAG: LamG-like jellyroll fold domain-containing protein [Ignavibacteria bacterium]
MEKTFNKCLTSLIIFLLFSSNASAQMFWNQAASFNGSPTSYVSVPNSASTNITGSFSIEVWVNPASLTLASKGIIAKGSSLGSSLRYGLRLGTNGRLTLSTNGSPRLSSKVLTPLSINKWTHVAATYNSSTNQFKMYLNGVLDTSSTIAGAAPATNTDSLFIGISGNSTPFTGQLDEVRLWNRELTTTEVNKYFRTSMAETSGIYSGLILAMTFQDENSTGADFNTRDISGTGNNGFARNVTAIDQSNNPYTTIHNNQSVFLNGTNSYLSGKDTSTLDAVNSVTLECWVYPLSNSACTYISKGSSSSPAYFLGWNGTKLIAKINGVQMSNNTNVVPLNKWSHIAFDYKNSGPNRFYINGKQVWGGFDAVGNITNNSDSIFIGGGSGTLTEFNGYIDEVRITKDHSKSINEIRSNIHNSIDNANDPDPGTTDLVYNLDGLLVDNCANGGPKLRFAGSASFSHTGGCCNIPVSPLTRSEDEKFSKGYYMRTPSIQSSASLSGMPGTNSDTLTINESLTINDINLFVAMNHNFTGSLDILLIGPNGDSVKVFSHLSTVNFDNSIATVFDDQADSSLTNARFITFSPAFKPANSLNSKFNGDNSQGKWILRINDETNGGFLYGWGIQLNNQSESKINFNLTSLIQGFYNSTTNLMVRDTMRIYLRDFDAPFTIRDSAKLFVNSDGKGLYSLSKQAVSEKSLYIQLIHRNSIETWSDGPIYFDDLDESYDFTVFATRAFGENQITVDTSPDKFAIYSGDVNRDGFVSLSDIIQISNDASTFSSGYIQSDITGDNITNLTDILLAVNNSNNFVHKITP